jgi:hypothetical protein
LLQTSNEINKYGHCFIINGVENSIIADAEAIVPGIVTFEGFDVGMEVRGLL